MSESEKGLLERARERLEGVWRHCVERGFVARGWGSRAQGTECVTPGSNIILCDGETVVVVCQDGGQRGDLLKLIVFGPPGQLLNLVQDTLVDAGLLTLAEPV